MASALQALNVLLPTGYLLSGFLHGMAFGGTRAPQVAGARRWALRATLLAHLLYFHFLSRAVGHFPVTDLWSTLSAVAFVTALCYGTLARFLGHPGSGGIVLGVVFLIELLAACFADVVPEARSQGMGASQIVHVTTSVVAAAALTLSGIHGILYIVLFREMRERRFGALFDHLPNLDFLARMTRRSAFAGFVGLTFGLNVGIWIAHRDAVPGFAYRDPGVLIVLALWIHFGIVAFSEHIRGFGARKASIAAALGFAALLVSPLLLVIRGVSFHARL